MKTGNESDNIAFVDIEVLPEYSFCLLKKDHESNDKDIFSKIIKSGVTYYKYYAIMVDSVEKYYVSSYQECENIIQQLKDKDSDNIDKITYIVKYESELKDFSNSETAVAELYVEKPKVIVPKVSTPLGTVATGANMSYAKVDLGVSFINPISGSITSRFGVVSSIRSSAHTGLDIGASKGTPVGAAASGTIAFSGYKGAYGNLITIDHGNGVLTYYAHCSALYKSVGEFVNQGDIIATVGSTGNSTGPHLHIEVRVNGVAYNPIDYFNY